MLGGRQRFYTGSAISVSSEGIFRCVTGAAAPLCWDWLTEEVFPGYLEEHLARKTPSVIRQLT